jgi:hypothetical protein
MLVVLITFGDSHLVPYVGNLDTIFGVTFWRLLDVMYPLLSVVVFLLYGKEKHGLKINLRSAVIFAAFVAALLLICLDDVALVLHLGLEPPMAYWVAMEWLYPVIAVFTFFLFGRTDQTKN